jgi:hypothetical protein
MERAMKSQNGWPVLSTDDCRKWLMPGVPRHFLLAHGAPGFVLMHLALWFHESIERLDLGTWDEWGHANRTIRGATSISNHASGTALDLNATRHPLGVDTDSTFTWPQIAKIRQRLGGGYRDVIRWGGDYEHRPDAMHFEINAPKRDVLQLAYDLADSPRGKRVLRVNRSTAAWAASANVRSQLEATR